MPSLLSLAGLRNYKNAGSSFVESTECLQKAGRFGIRSRAEAKKSPKSRKLT